MENQELHEQINKGFSMLKEEPRETKKSSRQAARMSIELIEQSKRTGYFTKEKISRRVIRPNSIQKSWKQTGMPKKGSKERYRKNQIKTPDIIQFHRSKSPFKGTKRAHKSNQAWRAGSEGPKRDRTGGILKYYNQDKKQKLSKIRSLNAMDIFSFA